MGTKHTNCIKELGAGRENLSNVLRKTDVLAEGDTQDRHFGYHDYTVNWGGDGKPARLCVSISWDLSVLSFRLLLLANVAI